MDILSKEDLQRLSEKRDGWQLSLFMPTHRVGPETQQDPIRLKNLLRQAEEKLVGAGLRAPEAREWLKPVDTLVDDSPFWQHQSDGLAIFVSSRMAHHYRVPLDLEELVVVAGRFHIKPLLPLLTGDGRFYVLALSQGEARLLQGTRYRVGEIDLEDAPTSLSEALRFDDPEGQLQYHTASGPAGGRGGRPAMFFGQGAPSQDQKGDILRYFQKLDAGLQTLLAGERAPLVLAGVDYLLPLYQEACTYGHLLEEGIEGNPDHLSAVELHRQAWAIVQPHFLKERREAANQYRQFAHTERASDDLVEIVPAAHYGRVDTLFVALDHQQWGTFDSTAGDVQLHRDAKPGDHDLADIAAVKTLVSGGTVYAVEPEQVPGGTSQAAIFRY